MKRSSLFAVTLLSLVVPTTTLAAQVIDLTVHDVGLAIGDKPEMTGLRINYRDRHLREITGVNLTLWSPYEPATGTVNGLALGVPLTGAEKINGALIGIFGGGTDGSLEGIGIGGIGVGAGGEMRGIMLGGVGVGSGGGMTGLSVGGIGVGSGGSMRGIQLGGIGVGGGGDVTGLSIGGIGVGTGGDATGLLIGGVGVGSGGTLRGLSIGGIGVGAPALEGVAIGGVGVGGHDVHAIVLTAGYFKVVHDDGSENERNGYFKGAALATLSNIQGEQHGLVLGLFNYARELHGAQVGLINVSDNGGHRRVLPLLSVR